ncbi:nucleotide sugar dehydrogenase [Clostridium hydrogeniformans]|uniref:nucleotide sugar dehydrogenase n=1 Tax=Clostridium hydrogeniformans TaxID=349933 RepID=UPI0004892A26|nr:nucleotide sugar dehydrogenase [Clostridium hydrogeniformans]
MEKNICVVGLGYIGLPTSAMFASHGHKVIGVDVNKKVVEELNKGNIIIEEPGLGELVESVVKEGNLKAQITPIESDVFIIAVPTPITDDKRADLSYVKKATESIVKFIKEGDIVILESTSPTGTTEEVMLPILNRSGLVAGKDYFLGHSPERVLPGQILQELINNNRIIGGVNKVSAEAIKDLYSSFVKGEMYLTTATTAEMCKMMENTFRDVNIALANELAKICEKVGINAWEVIELCNKHPRVSLHQPGPGVGGHCLAVDPWFIVERVPDIANIIKLSRETNDSMPQYVFNRIGELLSYEKRRRKVTVLGITYKPNIDDMRESPITEIIDKLDKSDYELAIVDPYVSGFRHEERDILKACTGSDLVLLAVNHNQFKELNFKEISEVMRGNLIFDTRNFLNNEDIINSGLAHIVLGNSKRKSTLSYNEVAITQ